MIVVSIDPTTGDTAMVSVPRNLPAMPFAPGTAMAERFPKGFDNIANAVYGYADKHRELMGGVAEIIAAFSVKTWGKFLLWMLLGVLYVAAGMIAIMNPLLAAAYLTLMLGFALVFGGVLRIFLAFQMKSAGGPWGWVVLSGLITLLLGAMIIAQWPASSLFVLGIFLGIDLIFIGAGWITMGLALKKRA